MTTSRSRRPGPLVATATVLALALSTALAGCTSEEDDPVDTANESVAASPTDTPTAKATVSPTGSPAPTAAGTPTTPAPVESPTPQESTTAATGCGSAGSGTQAQVDVRSSFTQLVGVTTVSLPPQGSTESGGYSVPFFEDLLSGVLTRGGDEVDGRLRDAVVARLGRGVVRDGLGELRVPLQLRNRSDRNQQYVLYASAVRREGSWSALVCPDGADAPRTLRGTFAAWQKLDHGVVRCGEPSRGLGDLARQAQQEGCR